MKMDNQPTKQSKMVLGGILIALGIFFLLDQMFDFRLGNYMWPFYIIVPGLLLCGFALTTDGDVGEVLIIIGSMVTMTGMLLLYQNTMDHYQSWAYAWALVTPTSIGLGQMLYGSLKDRPQTVHRGKLLSTIGIGIFLVGGFFFEFIIGFSGFGLGRLGRFVWPILLIGLGIFLILHNQLSRTTDVQTQLPAEVADSTQTVEKTVGTDEVRHST